jgi:hypothetical protein
MLLHISANVEFVEKQSISSGKMQEQSPDGPHGVESEVVIAQQTMIDKLNVCILSVYFRIDIITLNC